MDHGAGAATAPDDDAYADWRRGVAAVIAKGARTDRDALGAEPEHRLAVTTEDGVVVRALYTGRDELPEWPGPDSAPYVRGARPAGTPWLACVRLEGLDGERVQGALDGGAGALWVSRELRDSSAHGLSVPVILTPPVAPDASPDPLAALPGVDVCLGVDVVAPQLRGEPVPGVGLAVSAAALPGRVRAYVVDGTLLHEAGASAVDELGVVIAAGIAAVRALVGAGLDPAAALGQLDFRLAVTDDQFASIAKLRAARLCWARVAEVVGDLDAGRMRQHAVTSAAMTSRLDPWVNALRGTVAAFAAGTGGADLVTVRPFDEPLPGGLPGLPAGAAERLARTTQLLLLQEAHLGHVTDPAGGSWYVESLTDDLAERAWARVQELEAAGGVAAAAATVRGWVDAARGAREVEVAHRRRSLTGVNEFPDISEPARFPGTEIDAPYAARRYGAAFEALRSRSDARLVDTGARPTVFLAPLGAVAEHNARVSFTTNLLAAGGIATVNPGPVDGAALHAAFSAAGTPVAVVTGTDAAYATDGAATVAALRAAGASTVLAAGGAKAFPDGGPDGYLSLGIDAVTALSDLLDTLGVT